MQPFYFVLFTPVGWAVNDRYTGEEVALFGLGKEEYARAKAHAKALNESLVNV